MKRIPLWKFNIPTLCLCMFLAACGASPSGVQSTNSTTALTGSSAAPTNSEPPQSGCATFLPSAPCADYISVSGTSNGADLPWVASGSVKVQFNSVNGTRHLSVQDNCGPFSGPVTLAGNTMVVKKLAVGAVGCERDISTQHLWVMEFLKRPIEMTFNEGILSWKSGMETLNFKSQ